MPLFSKRHGYDPPKKIAIREELPAELRLPIFKMLSDCVSDEVLTDAVKKIFNPYGIDAPPAQTAPLPRPQSRGPFDCRH